MPGKAKNKDDLVEVLILKLLPLNKRARGMETSEEQLFLLWGNRFGIKRVSNVEKVTNKRYVLPLSRASHYKSNSLCKTGSRK